MQALTISSHGGLDRSSFATICPSRSFARPDDVRVRVRAAALNHLDLFVVGGLPGVTITPPWIARRRRRRRDRRRRRPTSRRCAVGDHVVINPRTRATAPASTAATASSRSARASGSSANTFPGRSPSTSSCRRRTCVRFRNTVTVERGRRIHARDAHRVAHGRHARARAGPAKTCSIWGIGGGVALAALQICKQHRRARVGRCPAATRSCARAARTGSRRDCSIERTVDVAREIRDRTGKRGVDVVVDNVGKATWAQSLRALGRRGRLVTCGATSGPIVETDVRRLFWNQWSILGSTMGNDAEFDAIVAELGAGRLHAARRLASSRSTTGARRSSGCERRAVRQGRRARGAR